MAVQVRGLRLSVDDPRLLSIKIVTEFAAAFALLPLISEKARFPSLLYVGFLLVLHLVVLVAYVYRVRFRELNPDWRSLVARLVAVAVVVYFLVLVSDFQDGQSVARIAWTLLVISVLHAVVTTLLMLRVTLSEGRAGAAPVPALDLD